MIDKKVYDLDYIRELQARYKTDPGLLERVLYAFGLLEALVKVGMKFTFKGGTSLMLLLDHPIRLSTDIDIIVDPGTDVESYIEQAGTIFPFLRKEEDIRKGRNNIEKRHFKFIYYSPVRQKEFYILLDIVFMESPYDQIVTKPIRNDLLVTASEDLVVTMPTLECILGDKLTAFAPHTTGVPLAKNKELEIAKQMFDVATLAERMQDHKQFRATYDRAVVEELAFRGLELRKEEVLKDTIRACISIISRGEYDKEDYVEYLKLMAILWRPQGCSKAFKRSSTGLYSRAGLYMKNPKSIYDQTLRAGICVYGAAARKLVRFREKSDGRQGGAI